MKKRINAIVLTLTIILSLLAVFPVPTFAATSGKCGDNVTWTLSGGTLTIKGTGKMDDYYMNEPWRASRSDITNVVIENGVTSIGNYAFYCCTKMTSITIADTVKTIGIDAFHRCISLESVVLPDSVTTLGLGVWSSCANLKSIVLSKNIEEIPVDAFNGCYALTDVTIPNGVKTIGGGAFSGCENLVSITIPDSVTKLDSQVFYWCYKLESITLSKNITEIGNNAFAYCDLLKSIVIPDSVTAIGNYAFSKCSSLESVTLSKNLKTIGTGAFEECIFEKIVLPNSLTEIGSWAFSECEKLTEITIPRNVTKCGSHLFIDCVRLKNVKILGKLTKISANMFAGCDDLRSIAIPDGVTTIEEMAFYSCNWMNSITIPESVTTIGESAFLDTNLLNIYYGGSKEQWKNNVSIGDFNDILYSATIHYNYFDKSSGATAGKQNGLTGEGTNELSLYLYENKNDSSKLDNSYKMSRNATATNGSGVATSSAIGKVALAKNGKSITISKTGFASRVISQDRALRLKKVFLQPDTGEKPIINAVWIDNIDVMGEEKKYDILGREQITIEAEVVWKSGSQSKIYLMQDSKRAEFSGNTLTTILSDNFDVSQTIYIVAEDTNGNVTKKKLKIKPGGGVYDTVNNLELSVGDSLGLTIPDNVPVIGGSGVGLDIPMLPITVTFDNNKFYAVIGLDVAKASESWSYTENVNGKFTEELDQSTKYLFDNIKDNFKGSADKWNFSKLKTKWMKAKYNYTAKVGFDADLTVIGYVEGYVDSNKKINILEGGVGINPSITVSAGSQLLATPPVYWEASIKGELEAMLNLYMNETAENFSPSGSLGGKITLSGGVGLGVSGVAGISAGITGNVGVKYDMYKDRQNYFALTGAIGAYAKGYVGPVTFLDVKENFAEGVIVDHPSTRVDSASLLGADNIYKTDSFQLIDRGYLSDTSQFVANETSAELLDTTAQSKVEKVLKTNIYPYSEPKMVEFSDGTMLSVWLDDDTDRGDINRTALMYSYYNGSAWSNPAQINDDNTGDYSPDLKLIGDKAYITWVNANKALENSASSNEMFAAWEISVAEFNKNSNTFQNISTLTNNTNIDMMPKLYGTEDYVVAVWVANSSNNIFESSNTYSIRKSTLSSGSWGSAQTYKSNLMPVESIEGYYNTATNGEYISYSIDTDGNQNDYSDKELYINGRAVTDNSIIDSKPGFANGNLYYYSGTGISEYNLSSKESRQIVDNIGNDRFEILTNGTNTALVFTESNGLANELYAVFYDAESGNWGEKVKISDLGANIGTFSGVMLDSGVMKFVVNKTSVVGKIGDENPLGSTELVLLTVTPSCNLEIGEAVYHEDLFVGGNTLEFYLPITNSGELAVKNYKVEVVDGSGNVLAHTYNETPILPGEVQPFTAFYPLDENVEPHSVTLRVVPIGLSEENVNNNTVSVSLNCENITVENIDYGINENNKAIIYAEIVNRGYNAPNKITASLRRGNKDGEVLETYTVNEKLDTLDMATVSFEVPMSHGEVYYITLDSGKGDYVVLQAESNFAQFDAINNTLLINSTSSYENAKMIVAVYKGEKIVDFKTSFIDINVGENFYFDILENAVPENQVKVFVWEGFGNLKPLFSCTK